MAVLTAVFSLGSPAYALTPDSSDQTAARTVVQQLHVTAIVMPMRHVILSPTGQIEKITSNTLDDVTPTVYTGNDTPENQQPMTGEIMKAYRSLVPEGTAKYGILYERRAVLARVQTAVPHTPVTRNSALAIVLRNHR